MDDNNIRQFGVVNGSKPQAQEDEETLPTNRYIVEDIDGTEFTSSGFLVFTSAHVAVMRDTGKGAVPVLVLPLERVKCAELLEEIDDDDELPF